MSDRLLLSSLEEAPPGPPPPSLLWSYAGLFGRPAAYRILDGERAVGWLCGVGRTDGGARRFDALPERLYGLLPYPGACVNLDAVRLALGETGVPSEVTLAPGGSYRAGDLAGHHRLNTFLLGAPGADQAFARLARVGRQGVRKAEQAGISVCGVGLEEGLAEYHELYAAKCRRRRRR